MNGKSPDAFRTISEVAEWLGVQTHVLRFWETKFSQLRPVKRAGGRRYYRPADMALLGGIRHLLHEDGMTIRGVQKILREQGPGHVATLSPPLAGSAAGRVGPDGRDSEMPDIADALDAAGGPEIDGADSAEAAGAPAAAPPEMTGAGDVSTRPQVDAVGVEALAADTDPAADGDVPDGSAASVPRYASGAEASHPEGTRRPTVPSAVLLAEWLRATPDAISDLAAARRLYRRLAELRSRLGVESTSRTE